MAKSAQVKKLNEWHQQLLDYLLSNPRASLATCAAHFEVSTSWISIVKNSDAFQAAYAKRRAELASEVVATVKDRTTALVETGLDVLTERIHESRHNIPLDKVQDAVALGAEMLGVTHRTAPTSQAQTVNIGLVDPQALADARALHRERLEQTASPQLKLVTESIENAEPAK